MSTSVAASTGRATTSHHAHEPKNRRELAALSLGALGIVYGDIGTSPLYAMKECLAYPAVPHAVEPNPGNVLGVVSLVFWSLMLVVTIKYLVYVLRADNKGEGGILALAALVIGDQAQKATRLTIPLLLALFGAGLLYGDGVITPAISVLGAVEGLGEQSHTLKDLVVPITVGILVALFLVQKYGTGRIGAVFGWVMLAWFVVIGVAGVLWIKVEPGVLRAFNPYYAARFFIDNGTHGFLLLGSVVLCVTGGEALYADMGHFGRKPIRLAWYAVVLPGLLLNYFGQGALFLSRPIGSVSNPFYAMIEPFSLDLIWLNVPLVFPMVALATMAAVIASQALISGAFSLTRQAMQLGFWPRLSVVHTSAKAEGQIYIPEMNYIMMAACVLLVLQFRSSTGLAAAYGIAVTGTMAITSFLFYLVCVHRWGMSKRRALPLAGAFLAIDLAFFAANAAKITHGGWFPLAVGVLVFAIMTTWWRGRFDLQRTMEAGQLGDQMFLDDLGTMQMPRVRGTAVFMASSTEGIPNVLMHHVKHNQVLHQQVVLLSIVTEAMPWVGGSESLTVRDLGQGFYRVIARVGFMQEPDAPKVLERCARDGLVIVPMTTTYYLGRQTLLTTGKSRMARWRKMLFSFLSRNSRPPTAFFNLPPNRVVELGLQIEL